MARPGTASRKSAIKKSVTPAARGKVLKSMNLGFYGPEPTYNGSLTAGELQDALTWYNYNMDEKDGAQFLLEYLTAEGYDAETLKAVKSKGDKFFNGTVRSLARIMIRGGNLPNYARRWFEDGITQGQKLFSDYKLESSYVAPKYYAPLNEDNVLIAEGIETAIENLNKRFSLEKYFKKLAVPKDTILKVAKHYQKELASIPDNVDTGPTRDYVENIVNEAKRLGGYVEKVANDTIKIKKPRKARTKKAVPAAKRVAKVKILQEFAPLGLKSVNVENILGAKAVWYYDTRYGKMTVVRSESGLDVKGTTIINWDEKDSQTKRVGKVGKRVKSALDTVLKGGKVALKHVFDDIKTADVAVTGRLSANIILLKVEK